jgi:heat shock protein HslJ
LVEKSDVENPPADASSIAYSLVSVVEKTAVETTTKPEDMGLDGTEWTLVAMGFNDRPEAVLAGTNITIAFAEDMVNGSAGCNSYFGNYSLTEAGFSVGVLGNTLMACEPDVMQQEDRFLQALAVVEKYSIENDTLIIEYDGGVMFFEKMAAEENMELEGTTWHLESFATKDAISSTLADTEVTATFAEGMVNGLASCNRYFGEATLVDGKATFGALGSTRMACVPEIMAQEVAFLTALQSATSYVIEGDVLTIDHADGSLIFRGVAEGDMGMDDVEPIPPVVAPITDTEMIRGEAFVDGFDINIMESFPVQVSLTVRGNLADGCTTLGDISGSVNADSKVIQINIGTVRPADLICTQALVPFEQVIPLDVAGLNAGIYTITVNGVSQEFTLEMDNVSE